MSCPVCQERKARRACPALSQEICTVCCGTKRLKEIHCPPDCVYLAAAREHPAAVERRQQEADVRAFWPTVRDLNDRQSELLWPVLASVRDFRPDGFLRVTDDDVAEAAGTLAATFETAARGVIYEHRAGSVVAAQLAATLKDRWARVPEARGSAFERDMVAVLRAVERGARETRKSFANDEVAYLGLVSRLFKGSAASAGASQTAAAPEQSAGGLIIP